MYTYHTYWDYTYHTYWDYMYTYHTYWDYTCHTYWDYMYTYHTYWDYMYTYHTYWDYTYHTYCDYMYTYHTYWDYTCHTYWDYMYTYHTYWDYMYTYHTYWDYMYTYHTYWDYMYTCHTYWDYMYTCHTYWDYMYTCHTYWDYMYTCHTYWDYMYTCHTYWDYMYTCHTYWDYMYTCHTYWDYMYTYHTYWDYMYTSYRARHRTYTYPVLTSDRSSFALTRSDPRSCKYDNEMVLLWKCGAVADNQPVSGHHDLYHLTIDEVMGEFEDTAKDHCDKLTSYNCVQLCDSVPNNLHNENVKGRLNIDARSRKVPEKRKPMSSDTNLNTLANNSFDDSICKETNPSCDLVGSSNIKRPKFCAYKSQRSDCDEKFASGSYGDFSSLGVYDEYVDVYDDDSNEDDDEVFVDDTGLNSGSQCKSHAMPVIHVPVTLIQCHNPSCQRISPLDLARRCFKNCHSCFAAYCGRPCRKLDWERHKTLSCHGSRIISACKRVIRFCNGNTEVKDILSRIARRSFISMGRGCIMLGFPDVPAALEFVETGLKSLQLKPIYIRAQDLKSELKKSRLFGNNNERLLNMCYSYIPEMKFVLNVGVGVGSNPFTQDGHCIFSNKNTSSSRIRSSSFESDGGYGSISSFSNARPNDMSYMASSDIRYTSDTVIQRCTKLRLSPPKQLSVDLEKTNSQCASPYGPTLIIAGVPGLSIDRAARKMRDLTFLNVQRKLRERAVNLKDQFPRVYNSLVQFVTRGSHFPSQIIYPRDIKCGKLFMCVLMPECEPDLEWTHSVGLLDDLDLSERGIWRCAPMTRFMSADRLQEMGWNVTYPCVKTETTCSGGIKYPGNNVTVHPSCDGLKSSNNCCAKSKQAEVTCKMDANIFERSKRKINRVSNQDIYDHRFIPRELPYNAHTSTSDHQNSFLSPRFKSKQNKSPNSNQTVSPTIQQQLAKYPQHLLGSASLGYCWSHPSSSSLISSNSLDNRSSSVAHKTLDNRSCFVTLPRQICSDW
ncbi:Apical junction component 1 [Bulinus truncatus]|nr:Apical junction component 1 [Bulinus truncatus]